MKAIVYTEFGDPYVLKIQEVEKPLPKGNEVLIRIRAVSVNYGDIIARKFRYVSPREFNMPLLLWIFARLSFGMNNPKTKILGNTFAGEIESIGNDVKLFRVGEQVFGYTGEKMGAYAEYLCMPENGLITGRPANMTYEEASVIPYGTLMALNLLKKTNIQKGQKVLIIGASGGIGSAAVQLAKHYFGAEVTAVCSTPGLEFVKNLGADNVIDYTKEDYTQSGEKYDIIFDKLGKGSYSQCKKILKESGFYLLSSFKLKKLLQMFWTSKKGGSKVICAFSIPKTEDLILIKKLIEDGKIKSIIDKCFPLEQTAEAHKYFETGNKRANVVIQV